MEDVFCPRCEGKLNIDGNIVFSVKTPDSKVGLLLLVNKPGDYHIKTHPSFSFTEGELVTFYCPICHSNLISPDVSENLIMIHREDEEGKLCEVLFSAIAGEHSTYIIRDKDVKAFGEDAPKYVNYFGENFHF